MKPIKIAFLALLTALPVWAVNDPVQNRGTDILHYSAREAFVTASNVTAEGRVDLTRKEQGNSQHQALDIAFRKLAPTNSYLLLSLNQDETNYTYVASFETDSKGKATLRYVSQGNGKSLGHGKKALPQELNPVSALAELVVTEASTQAVAVADLTAPDKLSYLVKRDLSTSENAASLRIKANHNLATIKLVVGGLIETNEYWLALNGTLTETNFPPAGGQLVIDRRFDDPLEVLGLHSLYLLDGGSNVVVGTTLP